MLYRHGIQKEWHPYNVIYRIVLESERYSSLLVPLCDGQVD
jgi:hypothetical protein